jgi:hypothetical protein
MKSTLDETLQERVHNFTLVNLEIVIRELRPRMLTLRLPTIAELR